MLTTNAEDRGARESEARSRRRRFAIPPIEEHQSLAEKVYTRLRAAIIDGDIEGGERLAENQLAADLGVSRSPVREAIRKLEQEGIVKILPRLGAFVTPVSVRDVDQVLSIRCVLEGFAAELASDRLTAAEMDQLDCMVNAFRDAAVENDVSAAFRHLAGFHELIVSACGAERLIEIITELRDYTRRYNRALLSLPGEAETMLAEITAIAGALRAGDGRQARILIEAHLTAARVALVSLLKRQADDGSGADMAGAIEE